MAITDQQKAIISATVPILEKGGETLTTHFYQMMLKDYPEVRPLFNQTNQANHRQPRALANAVLAYAKNIDHLEKLGDAVNVIVNKHVSLQILPEHYPIVGTCLLKAMREVLGPEIATDEVISAWGAAYNQLADILIGAEENEYSELAAAPGGWRGSRHFKLTRRVPESSNVVSFYFEAQDGKEVIHYKPGQYIGVRTFVGSNGKDEERRDYSISETPTGKDIRISVKHLKGGKVSSYLHEHVKIGDVIEFFPPAGEFFVTPETDVENIIFITAGIGITPAISMLGALFKSPGAAAGKKVTFIHADRNPDVAPFRAYLDELAEKNSKSLTVHHVYNTKAPANKTDVSKPYLTESWGSRLNHTLLEEWLPKNVKNSHVFLLGPPPFMRDVRKSLMSLGIPKHNIQVEFFGPAEQLD